MVWIHGGAFLTGSNDPFMYGPEYFYSKDVKMERGSETGSSSGRRMDPNLNHFEMQ